MTTAKLALEGVGKRFVKPLDLAARAANLLGAGLRETVIDAVDGVDLRVDEGEVVGLAGESGCGKTTLGRIIAGIIPPSRGAVGYSGQTRQQLAARGGRSALLKTQMIFQDPMASLNPRMRVADIIGEAPVVHGVISGRERAGLCRRAARTRRPRSRRQRALSPPIFRRPARPHRHCPRPRGQARSARVR